MEETVSGTITEIIRWYDIAVLGGIFIIVISVSAIAGETTPSNLLDIFSVSLIIYGLIYIFIGLFGDFFTELGHRSEKRILDGYR